ncbi:MAG: hypothetical protein MHPSP_002678 [Paramarteilia canceri]
MSNSADKQQQTEIVVEEKISINEEDFANKNFVGSVDVGSNNENDKEDSGTSFVVMCVYFISFLLFPIFCCDFCTTVDQTQRGVVFRLGKLKQRKPLDPGLHFKAPMIDKIRNVDIRSRTNDIPSQQETVKSTGEKWGVAIENIEIQDIKLPNDMKRSMAVEAEATREANAKLIAANGEKKAAKFLQEAANEMSGNPQTMMLRYLQTLNNISSEKGSQTIIFPIPVELMNMLGAKGQTSLEKV